MGKHKVPHIKKLSTKTPAATLKEKTHTIGAALSLSGNIVIAPTGAGVTTGSTTLDGAINSNNAKKIAAKGGTTTLKNSVKAAVDLANAAGIIVEQQLPGDTDAWTALGYEFTMEDVPDTVKPGAALHGSATQGDVLGTSDVHHDPVDGADDYRVYVTKGAVGVRAGYIDVTNYEESTSASSSTVTLPADYLDVPLNFIIVAHNTAGDGPDSTPFGGGRKIQ